VVILRIKWELILLVDFNIQHLQNPIMENPANANRGIGKWRMVFLTTVFLSICTILLLNCEPAAGPADQQGIDEVLVEPSPGYPAFLNSKAYEVPHDADNSLQKTLAIFAWQEFIALNWPSSYNSDTHERGKPDTSKTVKAFLNPTPDQPLVWQTYMHRVEVFPDTFTTYNPNFDRPPHYSYNIPGQASIQKLGDPSAPPLHQVANVFNNLDEVTEINLCTLFLEGDSLAPGANQHRGAAIPSGLPGAPRRVIYEAKANREMFDYVVKRKLYDPSVRTSLIAYTKEKISNVNPEDTLGGLYPCGNDSIICFPHGIQGGSEGSIEIKAAWRQLTMEEYQSGRFITSDILYYRKQPAPGDDTTFFYQTVPATPTENSLPYGLVGLHIIHKTKNFPTYVFATFEQVDILDRSVRDNTLFYYNRDSNAFVSPKVQYVTERTPPIKQATVEVTDEVHRQIKALDPNSVWQYYRLVGVQGPASNDQDTTDFFLSNLVVETNTVLSTFSGTLDNRNGTKDPRKANIHKGQQLIIGGGCKGCHGNAQQSDFSFITQNAPFDGLPDVINQPLLKTRPEWYAKSNK